MSFYKYLTAIGALLIAGITSASTSECTTSPAVIAPYHIEYRTTFSGFNITSTRKLTQIRQNQYQVDSEASLFFVAITERSRFELRDGQIRPLEYLYKRKGLSSSQNYHLDFSWQTMSANNLMGSNHWQLSLQEGMQDLLSHQEQLRLDLRCAAGDRLQQPFSYLIAKKKRIRDYRYQVIGEERLSTPVGSMRALKIEKLEGSAKRQTTIWLALDWDYVILRLEYRENGKSANQLELLKGDIAGKNITGLTVD